MLMDMAMIESVVIRVDELNDEILFPSSWNCSTFSKLLTQLEMSYLFTPEFIGIVQHIQKHTGALKFCSQLDLCPTTNSSIVTLLHSPLFDSRQSFFDQFVVIGMWLLDVCKFLAVDIYPL